MRINTYSVFVVIFCLGGIFYLQPCQGQHIPQDELAYDIQKVYKPLSISKDALTMAQTVEGINPHFKPSWIKTYISTEILATIDGRVQSANAKNDTLTNAQRELMRKADLGSNISVKVNYIPDNTLPSNDPKVYDFKFSIYPDQIAEFPGGQGKMKQYLKETVIDHIPDTLFGQYQLAAVRFTINQTGEIINPSIFWSSEDESIDALLLEAVCNMPIWNPGSYTNGPHVEEEFALLVGSMKSCVINMLNVETNHLARFEETE